MSLGPHISYTSTEFYHAKAHLHSIFVNPNISSRKKLHCIIFSPVNYPLCLLSLCLATNTQINRIQELQNTTLRSIRRAPKYLTHFVIARDYNITSIRKEIKTLSLNFFNNPPSIDNNLIQNILLYDPQQYKYRKRPHFSITIFEPVYDMRINSSSSSMFVMS